ncbi:hypothetical protein ACT17_32555 [Mycolicibacterium conceptionense]|uniref:Uncharacterized protein n=1 Tax=Mycolicibacterium conceptionense TaxID=451644 RepID=A0A0J8TWV8_9MYCO|nr:hypothetical protein [Mycolicibacterium conceptionense]KMV13916.1 hypothetical protein ACT17_32555 [Mycolicibacterium conceptionense]
MKIYRSDLMAAVTGTAGPAVLAVIESAPTSALAPIAVELGMDPSAVSSVRPSTRLTHDVTAVLRELSVAQASERFGLDSHEALHGVESVQPVHPDQMHPSDMEVPA